MKKQKNEKLKKDHTKDEKTRIKFYKSKEYWIYTGVFLSLMIVLAGYILFGPGLDAPAFTYADF